MRTIEDVIIKHCKNSENLRKIYLGNDKLNYIKSKELQKQQEIEYKKMLFFKNLKKEMSKQ